MIKRISQLFDSEDYYKVLTALMLFAFVIIFIGIGLRSPWPADEPRFAEIAKEMVVSGNWFFPIRGGELYPDKPPIFMWAIAFFYWLTGNINVAFLLPNAIASLLTLLCVYDLAAKLWNVKVARNAFLLMMLLPQFVLQAKTAQIDAMVACWITVAMYGLIRHYFIQNNWMWYCLSWGFMGLGIITKGVGFLPILFLIPAIAYRYKEQKGMGTQWIKELVVGLVSMLVVIGLWLVPMLHFADVSGNPDFMAYRDNILFKQTAERYANSWGHIKPWYYYVTSVVPVFWFPLSLVFFSRSFWRNYRNDKVVISLLVWIALVVFFFSLSPGKRGVYILPSVPMLALAFAPWVTNFTPERWIKWAIKGFLWLLGVAFFVLAVLLLAGNKSLLKNLEDPSHITSFVVMFVVLGIIWTALLYKLNKKKIFCQFGSVIAVSWIIYSTWGYVLLDPMRTPAKEIMATTAERIGPEGELGLVNFKEQFLLFSPIPVTQFSYLAPKDEQYKNAWLWMKEAPNRYIMAPQRENPACFDPDKAEEMGYGHRTTWVLYGADSMKESCEAPAKIKRYEMPFRK